MLLEIRLRDGLPISALDDTGYDAVPPLVERGLLDQHGGRLTLTAGGRLLADAVVRELLA
ncbi:MAG: hypothetical protein R2731_16055 [Nocardioides sp.]